MKTLLKTWLPLVLILAMLFTACSSTKAPEEAPAPGGKRPRRGGPGP